MYNSYIEIDGTQYRNMPSQIQKNKDDIAELKANAGGDVRPQVKINTQKIDYLEYNKLDNFGYMPGQQIITDRDGKITTTPLLPPPEPGARVFVVFGKNNDYCDKTPNDIKTAYDNGSTIYYIDESTTYTYFYEYGQSGYERAFFTRTDAYKQTTVVIDSEKYCSYTEITKKIPTATVSNAGIVKPDGTTIKITSDGTISSVGEGGKGVVIDDNVVAKDSVWSSQKTRDIISSVIPQGVVNVEKGNNFSSDIVSDLNHNVECKITRINLLDSSTSISGYQTSGTPILTGYKVKGNWYAELIVKNLIPQTKYYLQYNTKIITGASQRVVVKDNNTQGKELAQFKNGVGGDFTAISNTICIMFYVGNGSAGEIDFTNLILSETPHSYVPYVPNLSSIDVIQTGTGITTKTYHPQSDGNVPYIKSTSPQMTIKISNTAVVGHIKYYLDTKKYIDNNLVQMQADIDYMAIVQGVEL